MRAWRLQKTAAAFTAGRKLRRASRSSRAPEKGRLMNIGNLLIAAARTFGAAPAVAWGSSVCWSYRDFLLRSAKLAAGLSARFGDKPGGRVAIMARNCPEYMEVMWAAWLAGLCIVPVNAKLHAREVAYILANAGAKLCFASDDLAATLAAVAAETESLERVIAIG